MNTLSDMASEQETVVKHIPSYLLAYTSLVLYGKLDVLCTPLNPSEIDGDFWQTPTQAHNEPLCFHILHDKAIYLTMLKHLSFSAEIDSICAHAHTYDSHI